VIATAAFRNRSVSGDADDARMRPARWTAADAGHARAIQLARRIGTEVRLARMIAGLTQAQVAARAGTSQTKVSRIERGLGTHDLGVISRAAAAVGHELGVRLYPTSLVRLRDGGQLGVARAVVSAMAPPWSSRLEVPVSAQAADRRAVDVLATHPDEVVAIEIERWLSDFQAQLRAGQLKRDALAERAGRPVRLVVAVRDTHRNRLAVREFASLLEAALPMPSHRIWRALRSGKPISGDGILWVRERSPGSLPSRAATASIPIRPVAPLRARR
jgi:transcriptional regulator with XRE-family HTH domain